MSLVINEEHEQEGTYISASALRLRPALRRHAAQALGLDPSQMSYEQLLELDKEVVKPLRPEVLSRFPVMQFSKQKEEGKETEEGEQEE